VRLFRDGIKGVLTQCLWVRDKGDSLAGSAVDGFDHNFLASGFKTHEMRRHALRGKKLLFKLFSFCFAIETEWNSMQFSKTRFRFED
jgi:hypothetical protein